MLALRLTYLTGRVYSARFDDGDDKAEPEWPPHPSRLFSALVATWGEGGADEKLKPALTWIEEQAPPTIYAGPCTFRKVVRSFVPVNDSSRLPEDRSRKSRCFPSAFLSHPVVYFVWKDSPPASIRDGLKGILQHTCSLGHSASLVAAEMVDAVPADHLNVYSPDAHIGTRMRIPYPGRLKELMHRYEQFQKNPNKIHRPSFGRSTLYALPPEVTPVAPQGIFERMIILRRETGPRSSLRSTLSLITALRGAMLKFAPQPIPEYLSGHSADSTPDNPVRSQRPHVALVPLSFVAAPHATGELIGAAVLLPKTLVQQECEICWRTVSAVSELDMPWGRWTLSLADAEEHRRNLLPETWTQPHTTWSTVTPFVFDRYPKEPYGYEAEQIIREAFTRTGLPESSELHLHYNPWHIGVPRASNFPPAPARPGKPQRYHCHVWARFDKPIAGPVIAGAGRYYGYGLFRPIFTSRK